MAGHYAGEPYTDTWDEMRARTWEADTENLTVLLGLIGAGRLQPGEQQRVLRAWTQTGWHRRSPVRSSAHSSGP